jgi:hypothetical protein
VLTGSLCHCTKGYNIIILVAVALLVTIVDVYCYKDFQVNELQMCRHRQQYLCNISIVSYSRCFCAKDYTLSKNICDVKHNTWKR